MSNANTHPTGGEEEIDYLELDQIIEKEFNNDKENLIMILHVSEKLSIPYSRIYEVSTFYSTFSLEPRGRNIISICTGTACHVRGADRIKEHIETSLNIRDGETTEDKRYTLESVRCIGCCSLGPVVKINEDMHGRIATDEIKNVLNQYE